MAKENPFGVEAIKRRVMPLIFLVDTSSSMDGAKIASLNMAIRETLGEISEISRNNSDASIKLNALEFSSSVRWMHEQMQDAENFKWADLKADGMTSMGGAFRELGRKLTRRDGGFMKDPAGMRSPALILLSDGEPTDDYKSALRELKENRWFNVAVKAAIGIGDDANFGVLKEFTGSAESVIKVHDVDQLKNIIRTVSMTMTMVGSQRTSLLDTNGTLTSQAGASLKNQVANDETLNGVDLGNSTANAGTDNWDDWK